MAIQTEENQEGLEEQAVQENQPSNQTDEQQDIEDPTNQ